ncbi:MAG: hypothetical protein ACYS0I_08450 [Planctomycetota bacterium]|jgi:hypothetical protein
MRKKPVLWWYLTVAAIALLCLLGLLANYILSQEKANELVFKLKEVSAFDVIEQEDSFVRGQRSDCSDESAAEVKAYPGFKSDKPLYGSVKFGVESGQEDSGILYHFAVDESAGTGKGYDRFYFDINLDLDLTNDLPLSSQQQPPDGAVLGYSLGYSWIKRQVCFDYLYVNFDFGPSRKRPLEIMPRLAISYTGYPLMSFVATKVRKGKIKIANQRYDVFLGHDYLIGGLFDQPSTALHLIPKDDSNRQHRFMGADRLRAMHNIGGKLYRFSATPAGDKLIVREYDGQLGMFEVGPGGRDIQEMTVRGSLQSKNTAVVVGGELEHGWLRPARSCSIPVGNYLPNYLTINFGRLSIGISYNYHSDGKPRDRAGRPKVYGIKIRKDKPYIFDFSNKPDVMFASPAKDQRLKLGEQLMVKAILIDPELDIMIRRLNETSRKETKEYEGPDGEKFSYEQNVSLDPKVTITRANGEKVAEGVMPFG